MKYKETLIRPFSETAQERAAADPKFLKELVKEALSALQEGEPED